MSFWEHFEINSFYAPTEPIMISFLSSVFLFFIYLFIFFDHALNRANNQKKKKERKKERMKERKKKHTHRKEKEPLWICEKSDLNWQNKTMKLESNKKTNNINNFIKRRIIQSVSIKRSKRFWSFKSYKVYSWAVN